MARLLASDFLSFGLRTYSLLKCVNIVTIVNIERRAMLCNMLCCYAEFFSQIVVFKALLPF